MILIIAFCLMGICACKDSKQTASTADNTSSQPAAKAPLPDKFAQALFSAFNEEEFGKYRSLHLDVDDTLVLKGLKTPQTEERVQVAQDLNNKLTGKWKDTFRICLTSLGTGKGLNYVGYDTSVHGSLDREGGTFEGYREFRLVMKRENRNCEAIVEKLVFVRDHWRTYAGLQENSCRCGGDVKDPAKKDPSAPNTQSSPSF